MRTPIFMLLVAAGPLVACGGPPCKIQQDCPTGFYCVLEVSESGGSSGSCQQDCAVAEDCEQPSSNASRAICTNLGQCKVEARPPTIRLFEPESDALFDEGTRTIRVSGEVESAADRVTVRVDAKAKNGCAGGGTRSIVIENPTPGDFSVVPFVVDEVVLDPGVNDVTAVASVLGSDRSAEVQVEIACPGCAMIKIDEPGLMANAAGLDLPRLRGSVQPSVDVAIWRVHGSRGDVLDGSLPVSLGFFSFSNVPLFPGVNRLEVVVTGVGSGLGESRCSAFVTSGVALEKGLRSLLTWDADRSDLDMHLIGPGGHFGELMTTLSSRSSHPFFGGTVVDDFDGFGPERVSVEIMEDGVWGVVVEPVYDANGTGSNALLRLLFDGRNMTAGPIGPRYVSADAGELWIVGTIQVANGSAVFQPLDETLPAAIPPTTAPSEWPSFY